MKQFKLQSNSRVTQMSLSARQIVSAGAVFLSRLNVLPSNISPLGSYGFFGHPLLFFITIVLFDFFVKGIYPGVLFTYLGFAAYPLLGKIAEHSVKKQLMFLPLASLAFFLFSNFGVWWYWYPHTVSGLMMCYALAVPFYGRTLLSDVCFGYSYILAVNFKQIAEKIPFHRTFSQHIVLE